MVPIFTLFVVFSALTWPTEQKLVIPDACKVALNPFLRQKCGGAGATRESCSAAGCCFVENEPSKTNCPATTNNGGNCYYPAQCEAGDAKGRVECGWEGISRKGCNCRGCCYDESNKGADIPKCFQPYAKSTDCDWEKHEGKFIVNNNQKLYPFSMSLDQCKRACEETTTFQCNSYEYDSKRERCSLSKLTWLEAKHLGLNRESPDYVTFSCKSREPTVTPECKNKKIDLLLVIDESSSIAPADFEKTKEFAKRLSEKLLMSTEGSRVAVNTFAQKPVSRMNFWKGKKVVDTVRQIQSVTQSGGSTYTHLAIQDIPNSMRTQAGGRDDAIKVAIVQTDGKSVDIKKTMEEAALVRAKSIKLFGFGVGTFNMAEIRYIASSPKEDHAFQLKNFNQLNSIVDRIIKLSCTGIPPEPVPPKPAPTIPTDLPRFCKDIHPVNRTRPEDNLYNIDPDGPDGPCGSFRVECDFTKDPPETIVHNNQEGETCANSCDEVDYGCAVTNIVYPSASVFQSNIMTIEADRCYQYMRFDCVNSAIDYRTHDPKGPFTYWVNKRDQIMNTWGGGPATGGCACAKDGSCAVASEKCNCDARDGTPRFDEGVEHDKSVLPIREVRIGDIGKPGKKGCFRLGPIICI